MEVDVLTMIKCNAMNLLVLLTNSVDVLWARMWCEVLLM